MTPKKGFGVTICRCGKPVTQDLTYFQIVKRTKRLDSRNRAYQLLTTLCVECARKVEIREIEQ